MNHTRRYFYTFGFCYFGKGLAGCGFLGAAQ